MSIIYAAFISIPPNHRTLVKLRILLLETSSKFGLTASVLRTLLPNTTSLHTLIQAAGCTLHPMHYLVITIA
jgi:hypothetical protein